MGLQWVCKDSDLGPGLASMESSSDDYMSIIRSIGSIAFDATSPPIWGWGCWYGLK